MEAEQAGQWVTFMGLDVIQSGAVVACSCSTSRVCCHGQGQWIAFMGLDVIQFKCRQPPAGMHACVHGCLGMALETAAQRRGNCKRS